MAPQFNAISSVFVIAEFLLAVPRDFRFTNGLDRPQAQFREPL